jgi:hypothetical protein
MKINYQQNINSSIIIINYKGRIKRIKRRINKKKFKKKKEVIINN